MTMKQKSFTYVDVFLHFYSVLRLFLNIFIYKAIPWSFLSAVNYFVAGNYIVHYKKTRGYF